MILRHKNVEPASVLRLAFVLLLVSSLARWFLLRPSGPFATGVADGVDGTLHGVTIGTFLVGLWLARRRRRSP